MIEVIKKMVHSSLELLKGTITCHAKTLTAAIESSYMLNPFIRVPLQMNSSMSERYLS